MLFHGENTCKTAGVRILFLHYGATFLFKTSVRKYLFFSSERKTAFGRWKGFRRSEE